MNEVPLSLSPGGAKGFGDDAVGGTLALSEVALYQGDVPLDQNTTYEQLEAAKATYTGYAVKVVTWSAVTRADNGEIEYLGSAAEFRPTDGATPNAITGLYLRNAGHDDYVFACRFDGPGLPMESAMDSIRITIRFRPGGESLANILS